MFVRNGSTLSCRGGPGLDTPQIEVIEPRTEEEGRLAYTVQDAIAALLSAYADPHYEPNTVFFIKASIAIADTPPEQIFTHPDPDFPAHITDEGTVELATEELGAPIAGQGHVWVKWWETPDALGNLDDSGSSGFKVQRGATGAPFLLGLAIEPVYAFVGSLSLRPPAFARSFVQRHDLVRPKQYRGVLGLGMQPRFTVPLTEDRVNPKLTGTITPSTSVPGFIHLPATVEVVLESLESSIIQ